MADERCLSGGVTKANNNCTNPGTDGLPVQCVGPWAQEKHDYLRRYIEATRAVRRRYLPPVGTGGAGFIDLFSGPGVARVRDTGALVEGSPLIALNHREAPFSSVVLCELDPENVAALRARTANESERVHIIPGDSRETIDQALMHVPRYGLNLALLDPFAVDALDFSVIRKLATYPRMDLLIHFPTGDIRRNLLQGAKERLRRAIGRDTNVTIARDVPKAIEEFRAELAALGYTGEAVRSVAVKHRGLTLYHLMFASKDERGDAIWQSITKTLATGQRQLF